MARQDRSSGILVIDSLEGASGANNTPTFSGTFQSDVITRGSVISDSGRVTMRLISKDATQTLGSVNSVTINRYVVSFRRSDGRNTPGRDVPYPFDSAVTFTVTPSTTVTRSFELIRHVAKLEPPLLGLRDTPDAVNWLIVSTLADITFYGRDQAGREVSANGTIGIQFGDFADPQ
jgi:hypothetical protein